MHDIELDTIVDYRREYACLEKQKISGDSMQGLCPFHQDKNASLSVDLKTGRYKCFACGAEGNFLTFYAKMHDCDTKEAYRRILEAYHVETPKSEYTVEMYAAKKRLPADWLKETFELSSEKEKDGTPFIKIPYVNENGVKVLFRKRYDGTQGQRFKWSYGAAGKLIMYGEWRLKHFKEVDKMAILVEGESDTQTLTYLGFPALGIPGASTYRAEWTEKLEGIETLYLHIEPDQGGQTFLTSMVQKLHDGGYKGEVYRWSVKDEGVKDPSDLFIKYGKDDATTKIRAQLGRAIAVNVQNPTESIPEAIPGEPVHLRQPEGFIYSDKGISIIEEKTGAPKVVCRTPILITRRLKSLDTGDEKIELTFKRDGEWHSFIAPRSVIFQARAITVLADQGCTITSENAKQVVKFLERLEAENIEIIPKVKSTSTFGWQTADRFLPGLAPDIALDIEPSLRGWAAAYCQSGTFEAWKEMIRPHRERDRFRFILAAAFTAPLLQIVKQRIFFVYNWGGSKGGKSAALKAALSVWGDPERLMVNFNATQVALERMAGFYCDLPLGIDERQLAGNSQGALEKIVYMLASGTGRIRGSKTGGLQALQTWRTVILATGEEPIVTDTSQTGVSTRVLEIYGAPFENEQSASEMHQNAGESFGWAGVEFIRNLIKAGDQRIRDLYEEMLEFVYGVSQGKNGSHAAGIAAVATADALADEWIFGESAAFAAERAKAMVVTIVTGNAENAARDVNENAVDFIRDWIESNIENFRGESYGPRFGEFSEGYCFVFPSVLKDVLIKEGYNPRKTLKYMTEIGMLQTDSNDDRDRNTVRHWMEGRRIRMVKLDLRDKDDKKVVPTVAHLKDKNNEKDWTDEACPF